MKNEPAHGQQTPQHVGRSFLGKFVTSSLLITIYSSGFAALGFLLYILPRTRKTWEEQEFDLPQATIFLIEHRIAIAIAVGCVLLCVAMGMVVFGKMKGLRTLLLLILAIVMVALVAAAIYGWWAMYIDLYSQAGEWS